MRTRKMRTRNGGYRGTCEERLHRIQTADALPNELLCKVFSYLDSETLFYKVRPVCRRWSRLSTSPVLWKKIEVANRIPTSVLRKWIEFAHLLKELSMENRNDANTITEIVSANSKHLEKIRLCNCWGSAASQSVHSLPLCHLVTRCRNLISFNFSETKFSSCKFFTLMSKTKMAAKVKKKCCYYGPISPKQIKALLSSLREIDVNEAATIGKANAKRKYNLREVVEFIYNNHPLLEEAWASFLVPENIHNCIEIDI